MSARVFATLVVALALVSGAPARASQAGGFESDVARLSRQLPQPAAIAIARLLTQARARGLPSEALETTVSEGRARGVAPDRIVAAVRAKAAALGSAREALGGGSTSAELTAGASALGAGIAPDSLAALRALRPRTAVVPLVVMSDLVARGAPGTIASAAVLGATRSGVKDADLLLLREHIASDIGAGAAPTDAIFLRTRALAREHPAQRGSPRPDARPRLRPGDEP